MAKGEELALSGTAGQILSIYDHADVKLIPAAKEVLGAVKVLDSDANSPWVTTNSLNPINAPAAKNLTPAIGITAGGAANFPLLGGVNQNELQVILDPPNFTAVLPMQNTGNASGLQVGTPITKTGTITTTATTANQIIIAAFTPTGASYLLSVSISATLSTPSATATYLGTASLRIGATNPFTLDFQNPTTSQIDWKCSTFPSPGFQVATSTAISVVCTPAITTSILWRADLVGYIF